MVLRSRTALLLSAFWSNIPNDGMVNKVSDSLLDTEGDMRCAQVCTCHLQASHEGAWASTPTGLQATLTESQTVPVGLQAMRPGVQDSPACRQAKGRMEGSTTEADTCAVQGIGDRQSTAADVLQEAADSDAVHQVGLAVVPNISNCTMCFGVDICVYICVCMFKLHLVVRALHQF